MNRVKQVSRWMDDKILTYTFLWFILQIMVLTLIVSIGIVLIGTIAIGIHELIMRA